MLGEILKKEDCASCRFCCAFRRTSLWETPVFTEENMAAIKADDRLCAEPSGTLFTDSSNETKPDKTPVQSANLESALRKFTFEDRTYATYDLSDSYQTDSPDEEAPCPYLGKHGCLLNNEEKPWDCKIWPLRVMRLPDGELVIALTPTCPSVNKLDIAVVKEFVCAKLKDELFAYAKAHPYLIKKYKDGFPVISTERPD